MIAAPPPIRHALNYAVSSFAAVPVLQAVRTHMPTNIIIRAMRRADAEQTLKAYGPDHPEARRND